MTVAKGTGFVRGNRRVAGKSLASHLKYLEHRPKGPEETREDRSIFSQNEDHVKRKDALENVMQHTSSSVNYHKLVLSPSKDEPIVNWKEWTRNIMRDLENLKGHTIHWYAVKHNNTDDPHVHIVLAGSGEDFYTGRAKAVKMYAQDYEFLRERGREHSEYEHALYNQDIAHKISQEMDQIDREDSFARNRRSQEHGISKGIDR